MRSDAVALSRTRRRRASRPWESGLLTHGLALRDAA